MTEVEVIVLAAGRWQVALDAAAVDGVEHAQAHAAQRGLDLTAWLGGGAAPARRRWLRLHGQPPTYLCCDAVLGLRRLGRPGVCHVPALLHRHGVPLAVAGILFEAASAVLLLDARALRLAALERAA